MNSGSKHLFLLVMTIQTEKDLAEWVDYIVHKSVSYHLMPKSAVKQII